MVENLEDYISSKSRAYRSRSLFVLVDPLDPSIDPFAFLSDYV